MVWDLAAFNFVGGQAPPTVDASLWRQAQLNCAHGLFQASENCYQVRGFDLANITFIRGESGWIVVDPLTCVETAAAASENVDAGLGKATAVGTVSLIEPTDEITRTGKHRVIDGDDAQPLHTAGRSGARRPGAEQAPTGVAGSVR